MCQATVLYIVALGIASQDKYFGTTKDDRVALISKDIRRLAGDPKHGLQAFGSTTESARRKVRGEEGRWEGGGGEEEGRKGRGGRREGREGSGAREGRPCHNVLRGESYVSRLHGLGHLVDAISMTRCDVTVCVCVLFSGDAPCAV